jgi:quercetin dioxygenase-like cupin family protein
MDSRQILKTRDVLVRIMEMDKGSATDWHHHTQVADFFVCLSGAVQVETRGPEAKIRLLPGQHTQVTAGQVHRVVNVDKDSSEYLLVQGVGAYDFIRQEYRS